MNVPFLEKISAHGIFHVNKIAELSQLGGREKIEMMGVPTSVLIEFEGH